MFSFFLFMCFWHSISLSTFFFFFFCELLLCSKLCFLFFMLPLLLPPPLLFSFIYLLSDCVCVCVCASFYYLLCVACVRAVHSFYFVVHCFFFRLLKKLPNLFTTSKKTTNSYIILFFCACVLIPTRLLCVRVWFSFLLIIVGFLDTYTLYIRVYVCVCLSSPPTKRNISATNLLISKHMKEIFFVL